MMHAPSKSNLKQGQIVLLSNRLDHAESVEGGILEVPVSVELTGDRGITIAAL